MEESQQNPESETPFIMKPQPPLSIIGLLTEAFKTTRRNRKLVVSILILVFQLQVGTKLAITPVIEEMDSNLHKPSSCIHSSQQANHGSFGSLGRFIPRLKVGVSSSSYSNSIDRSMPLSEVEGISTLLRLGLLVLAVSCVTSLFLLVAAISSSYEAHSAKLMSLRDVVLTFRGTWKRAFHTSYFLTLISLGITFLHILFILLLLIYTEDCECILYPIIIVASSIVYLRMAVRWMLSLVVAVLESDSSGLKAILRSGELLEGKKIQAFVLMLLFHIAMGAVHLIAYAMTQHLDGWAKKAITIPFTIGLICILEFFMFAVYTVFYHDCKVNQKEEEAKGQIGLYVPSLLMKLGEGF